MTDMRIAVASLQSSRMLSTDWAIRGVEMGCSSILPSAELWIHTHISEDEDDGHVFVDVVAALQSAHSRFWTHSNAMMLR